VKYYYIKITTSSYDNHFYTIYWDIKNDEDHIATIYSIETGVFVPVGPASNVPFSSFVTPNGLLVGFPNTYTNWFLIDLNDPNCGYDSTNENDNYKNIIPTPTPTITPNNELEWT